MLRLVKAWPHEWLLHPFWSSAGPVKRSTGRQFGSRVVQVWPKGRLKGPFSAKRGTWPKPCYLLCFRIVWVGLGRHQAARRRPWRPYWRQRAPCAGIRALRFYWDLWKRSETDANGPQFSQTQAGSEVKVYLKAKTYD